MFNGANLNGTSAHDTTIGVKSTSRREDRKNENLIGS